MNKKKRNSLKEASDLLRAARNIIERVADNEQDCLDNMPENLQYSDRYEAMENAVDELSTAVDEVDSAIDRVNEARR